VRSKTVYVTTISIPVVFYADNDAEARESLEKLLWHFATDVSLGELRNTIGAEVSDAPTAYALEEQLPYEPLRRVDLTGEE
jgi:hypothetical protein